MEPTFSDIKTIEDAYQLKTYSKFPLAIERGVGAYVFDSAGKRYLDFYGGHCVTVTGHCHPHIVGAIKNQAEKLIFYSNIVYNQTRATAAKALVDFAANGMSQVFFCNSGAEANETAIKAARRHTGRSTVISMIHGFHGRTYGAMSITGFPKYRIFPPMLPATVHAEFGSIEAIEAIVSRENSDVAAIILEPVQSMAGVKMAAPAYYRDLRGLCDKNGIVLIFDEVQTGFARTGAPFFGDHVGVTPDLITCAKGIASGVPMGAVIFSPTIASKIGLSEHGATFGGSPIACAAATASLEVIINERLASRAKELGAYLACSIQELKLPHLIEVRGIGLLLGLAFDCEAKKLIPALLEEGVIIGSSEDPNVLRLIPPLTISQAHCDEFLTALVRASERAFA
jgi:acetylornithine/N-succinyldiaminopimelate aminotransferase